MLGRRALACAAFVVSAALAYPINTLKCCNTLARPDNRDECMSKIGRAAICTQVGAFKNNHLSLFDLDHAVLAQTRNLVCILERIPGFTETDCGKVDLECTPVISEWHRDFLSSTSVYSSFRYSESRFATPFF
jgi:hypothetical protein